MDIFSCTGSWPILGRNRNLKGSPCLLSIYSLICICNGWKNSRTLNGYFIFRYCVCGTKPVNCKDHLNSKPPPYIFPGSTHAKYWNCIDKNVPKEILKSNAADCVKYLSPIFKRCLIKAKASDIKPFISFLKEELLELPAPSTTTTTTTTTATTTTTQKGIGIF